MKLAMILLLALIALLPGRAADAHALEPGYVEITALGDGRWQVVQRKPQVQGRPMGIDAVLPDTCTPRRGPSPRFDGRAYIAGWVADCNGPLSSGALLIDGLAQTATDVLLRYTATPDGSTQTFRLTPDAPEILLPDAPTRWGISGSYFTLGVDHILGGIDHLLFVFALLLLIRDVRRLVLAITAFTIAHSITLAAAALGVLSLPMPPVEAVIALSIMFMANEILTLRADNPSLMQRTPWVVSFAFGLLHGLGFASALREIELPETDVPLALIAFNLGVEAGQLMFVAAVLLIAGALRLLVPGLIAWHHKIGRPGLSVAAYGIGGLAAFWTIDRVLLILA